MDVMRTLFMTIIMISITSAVFANDSAALRKLFAEERQGLYKENPATNPNRKGPVRQMGKVRPADYERRAKHAAKFIEKLRTINRSELSAEDKINYDLFLHIKKDQQLDYKLQTYRIPFYSDSGFHSYLPRMWRNTRFASRIDYEAYLDRIADIERYFNDHIANMRMGIKDGFTMPRVVLDGLLPTFSSPIKNDPTKSEFYGPFHKMVEDMSEKDKNELRAMAKDVIVKKVMAAYKKLAAFMKDEYYPAARTDLGAYKLPNGKEYYQSMVNYYTTLDISPEEIHETGKREVARIRAEMEEIIRNVKFKGSFTDFLEFLRTDPQFYAKSEKELLMHACYIAKKADGRLPRLFKHMPRQPYGVEAVPASIAPNYTTGRYVGAPLNAPRGGYYWVNTHALDKRPLYNLPALTLHEAVPGHHFQIALSKEMKNVPEFRKGYYPHAYGEGWGLYSEKLGIELDIYETPYEHFGRLSYEMWRACRLVIDTGIHAKGWSREKAIAMLEENSALSTHNIRTEVDRYISWPGQALSYKMGELKILELRKRATEKLGKKFDLREFHAKILMAGGLPLTLLERQVDEWIASYQ
ncbi:DUF885 domain-containing protein [Candidatus Uabimicrobium amorphum]|nr:DUF885 domain-containing protein [Candidatus Uabimicrobium amorphum]